MSSKFFYYVVHLITNNISKGWANNNVRHNKLEVNNNHNWLCW